MNDHDNDNDKDGAGDGAWGSIQQYCYHIIEKILKSLCDKANDGVGYLSYLEISDWQKRGTFTRQCHPPCLHGWTCPEAAVKPWRGRMVGA